MGEADWCRPCPACGHDDWQASEAADILPASLETRRCANCAAFFRSVFGRPNLVPVDESDGPLTDLSDTPPRLAVVRGPNVRATFVPDVSENRGLSRSAPSNGDKPAPLVNCGFVAPVGGGSKNRTCDLSIISAAL